MRTPPISYRDTFFRALTGVGLRRALRAYQRYSDRAIILCLHRVSDEPDPAWPPIRVDVFEELLRYLLDHFDVISLKALRERPVDTERPAVVITFDDGYSDFIENAVPILQRYGLPSVHSVVVDCVETGVPIWTQRLNHVRNYLTQTGKRTTLKIMKDTYDLAEDPRAAQQLRSRMMRLRREDRAGLLSEMEQEHQVAPVKVRMMNWDDIRQCAKANVEIGSHTMTHDLLPRAGLEDVRFELRQSRQILEQQLDRTVDTLAFPNGMFDDSVVKESLDAGYKNLLTVEGRAIGRGEPRDAPTLSRILIGHPELVENTLNLAGFHQLIRRFKP